MDVWSWLGDAFVSLIPPILVGLLFWVIMRSILNADKTERKVYQKMEAEMREARAPQARTERGGDKNSDAI